MIAQRIKSFLNPSVNMNNKIKESEGEKKKKKLCGEKKNEKRGIMKNKLKFRVGKIFLRSFFVVVVDAFQPATLPLLIIEFLITNKILLF